MASFYDVTIGQEIEFHRVLAAAGFTDEHIARIIREPNLATRMFEAIKPPRVVNSGPHPSWYVSPEQQLERVKQLNQQRGWGFTESDFPSIPEDVQMYGDEVLLLAAYLPDKGKQRGLYRTIDELWNCSEAPTGYTKWRWDELKAAPKLVRQAPGYTYTPGIRWIVFNPNAYRGKSPQEALELAKQDNVQLAGVEGLMANLLFPTWATSWDGKSSLFPWLSGLQFKYSTTDWPHSLVLSRWSDDRQIDCFVARWSGRAFSRYGSPSFRKCKN